MSDRTALVRRVRLTPIGLVLAVELAVVAEFTACVPTLFALFTLWALQLAGIYITGKVQIVGLERELTAAQTHVAALSADLRQALIDPVTGLPGRLLAEQYLTAADGTTKTIAVIDIDRMHDINHAHGHAFGDSVLAGFAALFRANAVDGDQVARLGGDEFVLITERSPADLTRPLYLATRLLAHRDNRPVNDAVAHATAGIAAVDGGDARTALGRADLAMNTAKRHASRLETYDRHRDGEPLPADARPLRRRRDRHTDPNASTTTA